MKNIYQALTEDHNELKPLLDQVVAASEIGQETDQLLTRIGDLLVPHSRAEEAVLYNSLREVDSTGADIVGHSYREHMEAELLLRTLKGLKTIGVEWTSATKKLRDALFHHIAEEESRVFGYARQVLFDEEAQQMAAAFEELKTKAQEQGDMKNMLDMAANMMPPRFAERLRNFSPSVS